MKNHTEMQMYDERQSRINALHQLLKMTDYKSVKAFEGRPSADWEEVKAKRKEWAEEIDALEAEIAEENGGTK
jgi:hypothetical protein